MKLSALDLGIVLIYLLVTLIFGLWLCSRLAQAMGGTIYLESKGPGLGATSVIELRRCAPPVQDDFTLEDYFI